MNRLATVVITLAFSQFIPLSAQSKPENQLSTKVRVYRPKYLTRARADQVARFVYGVVTDVTVVWEPVVDGLILNASQAPKESVEAELDKAEALIKRFDVPEPAPPPQRQIEMTVSLVRAYAEAPKSPGSVPPELAPVVKEMKGALPYAGFALLDTIQLNVRNELSVQDALPRADGGAGPPYFYSLMFREPSVSADGKTVTVQTFHFGVKIPVSSTNGLQYQDESISTPLTIYEGQKQVLGKIKLLNDDLFVVLTCKVK